MGRLAAPVTLAVALAGASASGSASEAAAASPVPVPDPAPALDLGIPALRAGQGPGHYVRPLTVTARVTQKWGVRGHWAAGHHTGVDLGVPVGTPVRSVGAGRVVFAGTSGDYGKAVTVRTADGRYTLFAHLSRTGVRVGSRVRAGTPIGASGDSGRTTGPHLHFEVRARRAYGSDIDPVAYMARRGVRIP